MKNADFTEDESLKLIIKKKWNDISIAELIGKGAFSRVYRTFSYITAEEFAVKVITIDSAKNEDELDACNFEISIMKKLQGCKNVVQMIDSFSTSEDQKFYFFLKLEILEPVNKYFSSHQIDVETIIRLGIDICNGLSACEAQGIVHRDIKPDNIYIDHEGHFKLGDFGIAQIVDHEYVGPLRKGGYFYISPEESSRLPDTPFYHRSDIYSLGIVLYQYLNNRRLPFQPLNKPNTKEQVDIAYAKRMSSAQIPPPKDGNPLLSIAVLSACSFKLEDRQKSAYEFSLQLHEAMAYHRMICGKNI